LAILYRLNTTNTSLDNAVVLSSKKILESLLATGAVNRREGVNRLTVDTKWFARADARARASRAEVGRRERVREASGCSNSEHARSIRNVRKAIRDFNSSDLAIFRHHESGARKLGLRHRPSPLFVADELLDRDAGSTRKPDRMAEPTDAQVAAR